MISPQNKLDYIINIICIDYNTRYGTSRNINTDI
jgi:hypothetical protein